MQKLHLHRFLSNYIIVNSPRIFGHYFYYCSLTVLESALYRNDTFGCCISFNDLRYAICLTDACSKEDRSGARRVRTALQTRQLFNCETRVVSRCATYLQSKWVIIGRFVSPSDEKFTELYFR